MWPVPFLIKVGGSFLILNFTCFHLAFPCSLLFWSWCSLLSSGLGEIELSGICFRFASDLVLVSSERQLTSLAEFAHKCCTVQGIANFELANHEIQQKMYPPVAWHMMLISCPSLILFNGSHPCLSRGIRVRRSCASPLPLQPGACPQWKVQCLPTKCLEQCRSCKASGQCNVGPSFKLKFLIGSGMQKFIGIYTRFAALCNSCFLCYLC